ncbi:MAG: ATPase, T2SS/T4P/T4SS family [Candidatus Aenigmatarchaeota archaeon]
MVCEYEYNEETQRMRVTCVGCVYGKSIEDYPICMATTIDKLIELRRIPRVVLAGTREYEYDFDQIRLLYEIANAIIRINEEKLVSVSSVFKSSGCDKCVSERLELLRKIIVDLKYDPIDSYRRFVREIRHTEIKLSKTQVVETDTEELYDKLYPDEEVAEEVVEEAVEENCVECYRHYLNTLNKIKQIFDRCALIQRYVSLKEKAELKEKTGDRSFYRKIFHPTTKPNFMYTRFMISPPARSELVERYKVGDASVEIYKIPGKDRKLYHIIPPEFDLSEEEYSVLEKGRKYLGAHTPREGEVSIESERFRENMFILSLDMIRDIVKVDDIVMEEDRMKELANILARYTSGLGVLELFLGDEKIQDIVVNSPIERIPIYIVHSDYFECETNIIPSYEDAESWATRFKLESGRPLDEANPVLDTELMVKGGRARVAAISRPLSPDGLAFTFRRHRDRPWTYPLFIKNRMIDSFSAGLMWFLIDGSRTMLIGGTRSSGKSSFLGASLVQIMPKTRIITSEDSVTGDCEIIYEKDGNIKKEQIGKFIDRIIMNNGEVVGTREIAMNVENIRIMSMDSNNKVVWSVPLKFIRHRVNKDIYEIRTRTGRKIKVTGDHSLFTISENSSIVPIKANDIHEGSFIVTPRMLPIDRDYCKEINLVDYIDKLSGFVKGKNIEKFLREEKEIFDKIKFVHGKQKANYWRRKGIVPIKIAIDLIKQSKLDITLLKYGRPHSKYIPMKILLDKDFLEFLGLWLADGCYDKGSIIVSVVDDDSRGVVKRIGERYGINVTMHSDGFSLILNSSTIKEIMAMLGFVGDAYTKRIPEWVMNLSNEQIAHFLRGIYSGDGYLAKAEIGISLTSEGLVKDIQTMMLRFGINVRINRLNMRDKTYSGRISTINDITPFYKKIGFLQSKRMDLLNEMCSKTSTHDSTDVIPLSFNTKKMMADVFDNFSKYDYVSRNNNIGRECFGKKFDFSDMDDEIGSNLRALSESDIFWDQVADIRRVDSSDYVYDISVPGCENFICENILAHNTLELPVTQLRDLGYNIERLKSRSVITKAETELSAEEALRTALRLGDSALILGEVRSTEAIALFEAMRIGALANVVAGTIHGESAYGVFDRIVNDLHVPKTSFKAMDVVMICSNLRSPDGMRSYKRVVELTEIRKHWTDDPMKEGGFVNLLEYSAKEDMLKPSNTLLVGESEVLNDIASRVREWKGRWDNVWSNINLRADMLAKIVEYGKYKPEMLESDFVIKSNVMFHLLSADVMKEVGAMDSRLIFDRWLEWIKNSV